MIYLRIRPITPTEKEFQKLIIQSLSVYFQVTPYMRLTHDPYKSLCLRLEKVLKRQVCKKKQSSLFYERVCVCYDVLGHHE